MLVAMGLNLLDDTDFWTFLKTRFEQGIIAKGIEPMDLPATLELGDGSSYPALHMGRSAPNALIATAGRSCERTAAHHVCYSCWGNGETPVLRAVAWPADKVAIEAVLLARPRYINRNWKVGETLAELQAENRENGVPVP